MAARYPVPPRPRYAAGMIGVLLLLAMDPRASLEAGDAAWRVGDREAAREAWRSATEAEDPALRAMAEVRMLRVSGNLGWMVHGPRAEAALAVCPTPDAWCDLAEADYELTLRDLGLIREVDQAEALTRRAALTLPEAAALRQRWLTDPQAVFPRGPGTWVLGVGVVGGPGLGLGGAARLVHPDLAWERIRLDASLLATSRGIANLSLSWRMPGSPFGLGSLSASRSVLDVYAGDQAETLVISQTAAFAGLGVRSGPLTAWAGPLFRLDALEETLSGHGVLGGARWEGEDGRASARVAGELGLADYPLGRVSLDLRARQPLGRAAIAARLLGETTPWMDDQTPIWRLPSAGGSELLRGAPSGRYRGPNLLAGAVELRAELSPSWGLAAFGELAWVPVDEDRSPHPGGGLGLRMRLPPRPDNTLRLDLGFTDGGWGLVAGWGEAF